MTETVPLKVLFEQAKKKNRRRVYPIHKNTSKIGIRHVSKGFCGSCKKKYIFTYTWYEDGRTRCITAVDLRRLKKKVLERGKEWIVDSKYYLDMICEEEGIAMREVI